jgi:hypothetical protein
MAFPKIDWLLKQNRESYEHFFCPACNHPIQRGPPPTPVLDAEQPQENSRPRVPRTRSRRTVHVSGVRHKTL